MIPENTETKKSRTAVDKKETGIKREKQKMEDGDYVEPVRKKSKLSSSNKKDGKNCSVYITTTPPPPPLLCRILFY